MVGDYIFAMWNHLLGSISADEMAVYEDEFGGSIKDLESVSFLQVVDCYVFLNDEPANCKYRVEHFRKNQSESDIPIAYYEGIDDIHFSLFVQHLLPLKLVPIIVLSWGQYHDTKFLWNLFLDISAKKKRGCSVEYVAELPKNLDMSTSFVYHTEENISQFYEQIKCLRSEQDLVTESRDAAVRKSFHTIYMPSDIMTIPYQEKGVVENKYNIVFYKNEFKRVVLWHLSRNQHVVLYRRSS